MTIFMRGPMDTLNRFTDAMAEGSEEWVYDFGNASKAMESLEALESVTDENTTVITFNSFAASLGFKGRDFWKSKKVRLIDILVDHPAYHMKDVVKAMSDNTWIACVDRGHVEFLKDVLPNFSDKFIFIPHGGINTGEKSFDKDIDVLYVGSFHPVDTINFVIVPGVDSEKFYDFIISYYENESYVEVQDAVKAFATQNGVVLTPEKLLTLSYYALCTVEAYYTAVRRTSLIERLADNRIHVTVCGCSEWKVLADKYPEFINYEGMVSPDECLKKIAQSKILINDLPYFSDGAHERIFNGMMNGAVVLTNRSRYLESRFKDGEDLLYWDGKNYSEAVNKVRSLLENDSLRKEIAANAGKKTVCDTWKNRAEEILCCGRL